MPAPPTEPNRGEGSEALKPQEPPAPSARHYECDACGESFSGHPGGAGLFIWTRGDEVRYEEPPLCEKCACEVSLGALIKWQADEEDEG
jgi:hypothetical protein